MNRHSINLSAVGVSAFASFLIGFLWFTVVFRESYLVGLGKTAEQLGRGPSMLTASVLQVAGNLVMALVLAWLIARAGEPTTGSGVKLGALAWAGFIAAFIGPLCAFQAYSLTFFAIITGYALIALLVMGAILGAWRAG